MTSSADNSPAISSEQFVALNDEIAALVRAGIPLELGLRAFGSDAQGALGRIADRLANQMDGGESLSKALADERQHLPEAYCALVAAGLNAGRLPAALEAVSTFTRELIDFRRQILLATLYPLVVMALAYGLFLAFLAVIVGRYEQAMTSFRLPLPPLLQMFVALRDSMVIWFWIPPALFLVAIIWCLLTRRRRLGLVGLPFIGIRHFRVAMFADLLSMQLENSVSLPTGIRLSAAATGSSALIDSAQLLADEITHGERIAASGGGSFPPFLRWLMVSGERQGHLAKSLKLAAGMYRRKATNSLDLFKVIFPLSITLFLGGGIVLLYALGLFVPFIQLLRGLGMPQM